jgi:hypothetical protein
MRRSRRTPPVVFAELALHSWETIAWRLGMIAFGTCSVAEYQRMVTEKLAAAQLSALALLVRDGDAAGAALAPWHRAAAANARRLRRRRRR